MCGQRFCTPCTKLVIGSLVVLIVAVVCVAAAFLLLDIAGVLILLGVRGRIDGGRRRRRGGAVGNDNGAARVSLQ